MNHGRVLHRNGKITKSANLPVIDSQIVTTTQLKAFPDEQDPFLLVDDEALVSQEEEMPHREDGENHDDGGEDTIMGDDNEEED